MARKAPRPGDQRLNPVGIGRGAQVAAERLGVAGTMDAAGLEDGLGHRGLEIGVWHGPIVAIHGKIAA